MKTSSLVPEKGYNCMGIATDPLSLLFIACIAFSSIFLLLTSILGLGQHGHMGAHSGGHVHLGGVHHAGVIHNPLTVAHGPVQGLRVVLPNHGSAAHTVNSSSGTMSQPNLVQTLLGYVLNLYGILSFLFFFGLLGYLLHNATHANAITAVVIAIIIGLAGGAGINMAYLRLFGQDYGSLGRATSEVTGRIAKVNLPIRANGIGEIVYIGDNGSRHSLGARSANSTAIPADADVVIVDFVNGIASVESWDTFVTDLQANGQEVAQIMS